MDQVRLKLNDGTALVMKGALPVQVVKSDDAPAAEVGRVLISTESVDSYGDIVHAGPNEHGKGWLLERWNKHPVILWGHDHFLPTIGRGHAEVVTHPKFGTVLVSTCAFDMADPLAATVAGKVERGFVSESSVGFVSKFDQRREDAPHGFEFFEQELVEWSWVNRGANPDVEVMAKALLQRNADIAAKIDNENFDATDGVVQRLRRAVQDASAELEAERRSQAALLAVCESRLALNGAARKAVGRMMRPHQRVHKAVSELLVALNPERYIVSGD